MIKRNLNYKKSNTPYPRSRAIEQYDMDGNYIQTFVSVCEAARVVGIKPSCISAAARGETKFSKGYIWKYKN